MPAIKYDTILKKLRKEIESGKYAFGEMLPSENRLTEKHNCSRNTVRRAVKVLSDEGYVQIVHGKGALVLYRNQDQALFSIEGVESMKEAAQRNGLSLKTKVIRFSEITADSELSQKTGFEEGSSLYLVQRVRYLDGEAQIIDHNYFLKDIVHDLTEQIAENSVYDYMELDLGEVIMTTRRKYAVEKATALDRKYLDLNGYNCLAVVENQTFNKEGIQFEYTISRHRPDRFVFYQLSHRRKS